MKMNRDNAYQLIEENAPLPDVLKAAAKASKSELESAARNMTELNMEDLHVFTYCRLHALGVAHSVYLGGMLTLYKTAADTNGKSDGYRSLCDGIGISKTKEYYSLAIFREFGRPLMEEPKLLEMFCVESLRLLSAKNTTEAARTRALADARSGRHIGISIAKDIVGIHRRIAGDGDEVTTTEDEGTVTSRGSSRRKPGKAAADEFWSHSGDVSRVVIQTDKQNANPDPSLIVSDLEGAIEEFRRQCREAGNDLDQSNAA